MFVRLDRRSLVQSLGLWLVSLTVLALTAGVVLLLEGLISG